MMLPDVLSNIIIWFKKLVINPVTVNSLKQTHASPVPLGKLLYLPPKEKRNLLRLLKIQ